MNNTMAALYQPEYRMSSMSSTASRPSRNDVWKIPPQLHAWDPGPRELMLPDNETHVWRASLVQSEDEMQALREILADDERQRADRFHFAKDRHHFTAARGILRLIFSRYLGCAPAQLRFRYSDHGKPSLAAHSEAESYHFNVSHSGDFALYAFTRNREVGVDIEHIRPMNDIDQIVTRFFSRRENIELQNLPPALKQKAFFSCWTRKEAYIKARGEGLSIPLDQFDVSLIPGHPARLLNTRPDPREASRWTMQELIPARQYIAALVVEGSTGRLKCWQFSGGV